MPTYGRPETAAAHPPLEELVKCATEITRLTAALAVLQRKQEEAMLACDHHFVPDASAETSLRPTLVPGVFRADHINDLDQPFTSSVAFDLRCTKCAKIESTTVSERCPICMSHTVGSFVPGDKRGTLTELKKYFGKEEPFPGTRYFGHPAFVYNRVWLIRCTMTNCEFKAVGLVFDEYFPERIRNEEPFKNKRRRS